MLHKTRGIALKTTNYTDNSVVVHVFTEIFGMQSYLLKGARKPKARIAANLFQPLHILSLVVYHKEGKGLQHMTEARPDPILKQIPLDMTRSAIAIFLNEVLYKVLRHQSPDAFLFGYLQQAILRLDEMDQHLSNFHFIFLIKLSRFLGFLPLHQPKQQKPYFNLVDGVFTSILPSHRHVLQEPHSGFLLELLQSDFEESHRIKMLKDDRKHLLEKLLEFYRLHTENFGQINSLYILEEIFKEMF